MGEQNKTDWHSITLRIGIAISAILIALALLSPKLPGIIKSLKGWFSKNEQTREQPVRLAQAECGEKKSMQQAQKISGVFGYKDAFGQRSLKAGYQTSNRQLGRSQNRQFQFNKI